eukprot:Hpha_TRINITY_DN16106_c1_g1::TRINITY_DN16106_c1_g1_i10::g.4127::m.4127
MSPSPFCCTRHREKEDNASVLTDEGLHLVDRLALLAGLHQLLPLGQLGQTLDQRVHQVHLTLSDTVAVRHVPGAASAGGVDTRRSAGLELHGLEHGLPKVVGRHLLKHNHAARAQTSAQVARARQDPAQVVVVHEVLALSLQHLLHLVARADETRGHLLDVLTVRGGLGTVTLHADDAKVVLLVQPHEKVLRVVVEDTTTVRPVPAHTAREQQGRVGLLEEVAHTAELRLLLLRHASGLRPVAPAAVEGEVVTLKVSLHVQQPLHHQGLKLAAPLETDRGGQQEVTHAPPSADTRGENVLAVGVDVGLGKLIDFQVRRLGHSARVVPGVARGGDGVEEIAEQLVGLLVTGGGTDGLDEGVTLVVHSGLDTVGKGDAHFGLLVLQLVVHRGVLTKELSHEVVVLGEVRHLVRAAVVTAEGGLLLRAVVGVVTAPQLDPLLQVPHAGGKAERGVVLHAGRGGAAPGGGQRGGGRDEGHLVGSDTAPQPLLKGLVQTLRLRLRTCVAEGGVGVRCSASHSPNSNPRARHCYFGDAFPAIQTTNKVQKL